MDSNKDVDGSPTDGSHVMRSEHQSRYESALARAAYHIDIAATACLLRGSESAYLELHKIRADLRHRLEASVDERYGLRTRPARSGAGASTPRAGNTDTSSAG
jgi:hypothetical protein